LGQKKRVAGFALLFVCMSLLQAKTSKKIKITINSKTSVEDLKKSIKYLKWHTDNSFKGLGDRRAKKGGSLKSASTRYPSTLRTIGKNSRSVLNSLLESLCYETLLSLNPLTYGYRPNLAKRWAIAEDKVSFFFEIDERAKWLDGRPVISKDVVDTWKLLTDRGIEDPSTTDYWKKYEKPVVITRKIIMIRSKKFNWRAFTSVGIEMSILPGHIISKMTGVQFLKKYQFKMILGSGPYAYKSSRVNESIILTRRLDWWKKDFEVSKGYNNFDTLDFAFIQDHNLLKEKFKKGDLDWMMVWRAREWHQDFIREKMPQIAKGWVQRRKVYNHRPTGVSGVAFNIRTPPFDDIRVRKAIAYLYHRKKMIDKLFFNEYEYLDTFYPNSPYQNPENPKLRFNPDKAVELLEEAGWLQKNRSAEGWLIKEGKRFELTLSFTSKSTERYLTIFQEDLRSIGIKLNLKQLTWPSIIKQINERNFKITMKRYGGSLFPTPERLMHSKFADKKNTPNIWGIKNKRIDEICDAYLSMFNPKERMRALQEIDKIASKLHLYAFGWYSAHARLLFWNKFGMPEYILKKFGYTESLVSLWWHDKTKGETLLKAMKNNASLPIGQEVVKWWDEHYPQRTKKGK